VGVSWVGPVALSFYAVRKVPPVARVVPTDLRDASTSQSPGTKLSYFGYEFEVPWTDLDKSQTKLFPADKPEKTMVVLAFRSGLRMRVIAIPAHEWVKSSYPEVKAVPRVVAANFGYQAVRSDYSVAKSIYEFSPDRMHYWAWDSGVHYREQALLIIKSVMLLAPADSGIFNIQNQQFKGFQQGNPQVRQSKLALHLYSDDGSVEFIFFENDKASVCITQPEINRIIQTLHKANPDSVPARIAQE
jgi:hypothetical protein